MDIVKPKQQRRAVFLDRDGVINENRPNYVRTVEDLELLPNAISAVKKLSDSNFAIVIVTNQSGVGRKIIPLQAANAVNDAVVAAIEAGGGRVDGVYLCPHHPKTGCDCRKPQPGMLHQAAADLDLDLEHSYMVGDAASDVAAATAANVTGMLVLTGRGKPQQKQLNAADRNCPIHPDITAAVDWILAQDE